MDENELQEFNLDDIIREFGGAEPEEEAAAPEEIQEDLQDTSSEEDSAAPAATDDTVRVGASVTSDTIRLDTSVFAKGQVRNAAPLEEEEEAPPAPAQEQAEPFTGEWEPEYEQPMGDYVPPQLILAHPRSRLRELKKKLVAGPEKQYYQLSEKGVGKLQIAIFLSLLVVLISAGATAMYALGMVQPERMKLLVFSQFLAMMISALIGSFQLIEGVADLFHKRFTLNTLLVFTFIACCLDGILCLKLEQVPCCAAFSLEVTMSLWSTLQRRNTQLGQLDTMRKATKLDSISASADYYNGASGLLRAEGQVEDFMDTDKEPSGPEKVLSVYALVALLVSVGIGVTAGVLHSLWLGIRVSAVTLLAAMPATVFITLSRPMAVLQRRLHGLGTVLCGWQGVKGLCQNAVFPLDHSDLFPAGTVKLNGVKFFSSREPDETVAYAAALIAADGGGLEPLFTYLLDSRNGIHYTAREYRTYDGGIGAVVNGEPVLAGSLSFLSKMGVELPEGIRVGHAVCVAVDGELCGLFAVTYEKNRSSAAGLNTLCAYRGLRPVLVGSSFMLTPEFLRAKFGSGVRKLLIPNEEERKDLHGKQAEPDGKALLLTTRDGLAPLAYGVTGARALKTASTLGVVIHMIGGIVGMLMMLVLAIIGAGQLLTPANLFLYELIWMIPGLLITEWTRTI